VRGRGLGFAYRPVEGQADPGADPAVTRFVLRMGRYVLDTLEADPSTTSAVPFLDATSLSQVARHIVTALEAPLAADFALERQSSAALSPSTVDTAGLSGARSRSA
jgi:hypothetical protein